MLTCDHFIYTSAKTSLNEGYQIVAKSSGISDDMISDLMGYYYPVGLDLEKFNESRSMLVLKGNKIAYSIIKNIGRGYDARKGTLYNHTFVIDKKDFVKIKCNTKLLDKYFIFDYDIRGNLDKMVIVEEPDQIEFTDLKSMNSNIIQNSLWFLTLKRKVAITIQGTHNDLIQNMLTILPPSLRIIPFSTLVNEPEKQGEFDLIQIPENSVYKLDRSWKVIEPSSDIMGAEDSKRPDFEYLAHLIQNEDMKTISKIHQSFETLNGDANLEKMRFLLFDLLAEQTRDIEKKARYYLECANAVQKIAPDLMSKYLDRAEKYSKEVKSNELLEQVETGRFTESLNKSSINVPLLEKILYNFRDTDSDVRVMFLKKIFKKRKEEIRKKGLLGEIILSRSLYQEEFLRAFVELKELHPLIFEYFESSSLSARQQLKLFETFIDLALSYNFLLINKLFETTKFVWHSSSELYIIKKLVNKIFSNINLRENEKISAVINLVRTIESRLRDKFSQLVTTHSDTREYIWNSDESFDNYKHSTYDILTDMANCLKYIMDYRKEKLSENSKIQLSKELEAIERIFEYVNSIKSSKKKESTSKYNPYAQWFWWLR